MIVLSVLIFALFVSSTKLALTGNPTVQLLRRVPPKLVTAAADSLEMEDAPDDDATALVNRIMWSSLRGIGLMVLELCVILYLLSLSQELIVPWILLGKNMLATAFMRYMVKQSPRNLVQLYAAMPEWALKLERFSNAISAAGFLAVFAMLFYLT